MAAGSVAAAERSAVFFSSVSTAASSPSGKVVQLVSVQWLPGLVFPFRHWTSGTTLRNVEEVVSR